MTGGLPLYGKGQTLSPDKKVDFFTFCLRVSHVQPEFSSVESRDGIMRKDSSRS